MSAGDKRIRENPGGPWSEAIGVVADIRHDVVERPAPSTVYWPMRSSRSATFMIRGPRAGTEGYAVLLGSLVEAAVASYVPARRLTRIHPIEALRAE